MQVTDQALKKLPYVLDKKTLMAFYQVSGMTARDIRIGINAIIADNRKLSASKSVCVQLIRHIEWREFVRIYGAPAGYSTEFLPQ